MAEILIQAANSPPKTIYDVFYSLECRKVYINTTLVLLRSLFVQDVSSVYSNFQKRTQFCFITFAKKEEISIKFNNITEQLESCRTLRGSLTFAKISVVISRIFLLK